MPQARLKHFGWGREGEGMTQDEEAFALKVYRERFGVSEFETLPVPPLDQLRLRAPRLSPPSAISAFCSAEHYDRAAHSFGKSYPDTVRGMLNDYSTAPDVVAYPRTEQEIADVMDWAGGARAALIPFGGGQLGRRRRHRRPGAASARRVARPPRDGQGARTRSTPPAPRASKAACWDRRWNRSSSHTASRCGIIRKASSISTLGGWIATRSGGHFATLYTHIDDLVESLRVVTPAGTLETRRLPGSGAGPSPDRLFIGSEGIFGVIAEAWMRRPGAAAFPCGRRGAVRGFLHAAARAVRAIGQAGLYPSNCRILDPQEAYNTGAGDGTAAVMVLAFESADHPLDAWMARALECCRDHGGTPEGTASADAHRQGAAGLWRNAFIRMPYARERMVPRAIITDTFETAITWDRFEVFHATVKRATEDADPRRNGPPGPSDLPLHPRLPGRPRALFHAFTRSAGTAHCSSSGKRSRARRAMP